MSAPKPCPGCGREWSHCTSAGDECWRNSGCPKQPPNPPLPDYIADAKPAPSAEPDPGKSVLIQGVGYLTIHSLRKALSRAGLAIVPAPVAAPCAGCATLQVDLAFAKSQRDDNENAWQCEKAKRVAREMEIALLLRRLRHRNEAIAFLTKNKLEFNEDDSPKAIGTRIYYDWWIAMRHQLWHYETQIVTERRVNTGLSLWVRRLQAQLARVGTRLHFKRMEAAHWQEKAGWEDVAKDG